ncbi:arylamine N-acetyltransferase [Streptomyces sp. MP131-18]|uniref:arylamine N-acetyltransferase family protein n=1 Tax=Streptomyces sp. MP131-18 TaxID=1857892 RepID=UPI00097C365A|nr:arylamine N-acetyltransferase [Streptomyces sp. MP131-18]ONK15531.1 Arylamine N-acetyltransferase [Streptomyces sp. MP131-18]
MTSDEVLILDDATIAAYLERIGAEPPKRPDLDALRHLHERHVMSVPFESIDYHLGKEIYYKDERVVDKIVRQRRGGGCGEINTAFLYLLQSLGYDVTAHHARVWIGGELNAPYNHFMMTVVIDGATWIVDVGFGKGSRFPVLLDAAEPQPDPHGRFSTRRVSDKATDVLCDGKPQYQFYEGPLSMADFEQVVWWYRTSPDSMLLQNMFCSLPLENGWVILKDDKLTITTGKESRTEVLADDAEILAAYEKWFGVKLDARPTPSPYLKDRVRMAFEEK